MSTTVSFRLCTYFIWSTTGMRTLRPWNGTGITPHPPVWPTHWLKSSEVPSKPLHHPRLLLGNEVDESVGPAPRQQENGRRRQVRRLKHAIFSKSLCWYRVFWVPGGVSATKNEVLNLWRRLISLHTLQDLSSCRESAQ